MEEEDSSASVALLNPLIAAKAHGIAVVFLRHSRKSGGEVNVAGRGSGAFTGEMDVAIQITAPLGVTSDYRYLRWVSRLTEADDLHLQYEDGSYEIGTDPGQHKQRSRYAVLLDALAEANPIPLTQVQLVETLGKSQATVSRWMKALEAEGRVRRVPLKGNEDGYLLAPPKEVEV
jgi:CTP-dependent riboflavin kinase